MNANEVMDVNMRTGAKKSKPEVEEMSHKRSDNGGHVFTHRMSHEDGNYHEPEMHTFGEDQGHEALAHFAKHAGLEEHMPSDEVEGDKDSAAGAAT